MALILSILLAAPPNPEVAKHRDRAERAMQRMREGDALLEKQDMKGACEAYVDTVELLPTWWMPHLAIVRCGRFTDMSLETLLEHARFAVKARPQLPITHAQLGLVLEEANDPGGASRAYEAALRLDPHRLEVRYRLGLLLARAGQPKRARRHLEKIVEHRPEQVVAWSHLASIYVALGAKRDAERALLVLAERSRFPGLALSRLIRFYAKHGMKKKAARARREYHRRYGPRPRTDLSRDAP